MHSFLCLFGSVWLAKKNSWHFQWTHRCSIIQWPQKVEQWSKHTQQFHFIGADSVLLPGKIWCGSRPVQLFIQALPRTERCVWQTATRHIRWRRRKTHTTTTEHRYEIYSEWQKKNWTLEIAGAQTFVSCLWSNCQNPIPLDIDWELVLSNQTLNNFFMQKKTEPSYLVSFVKAGSAICFLD